MPSLVPSRPCTAVAPSATITFGSISASCSSRYGDARGHLVGLGLAVLGRPALDDVADVDLVAADSPSRRSCGRAAGRPCPRTESPARPRRRRGPRRRSTSSDEPLPRANTVCVRSCVEAAAGAGADLVGEHGEARAALVERVGGALGGAARARRGALGRRAARRWRRCRAAAGAGGCCAGAVARAARAGADRGVAAGDGRPRAAGERPALPRREHATRAGRAERRRVRRQRRARAARRRARRHASVTVRLRASARRRARPCSRCRRR